MHLDSYGLPVQSDGDANDQLQRVGMVFVGALRHYHRAESGGNPEIAELWRPIIERELNKK